jgi:hypothetical protein
MSNIELNSKPIKNTTKWEHRIVIGTPSVGLVRIEWCMSRYGQIIPTNWSQVQVLEMMDTVVPLQFSVANAQNLIVQNAIEKNAEWVLFIESDNVLPQDAFLKLNEYMRTKTIPVVSGLYFTKSDPPEPMTYRGRGNSFYQDWHMGDKVWCDGIPTGTFLCHMSIMRAMWNESAEYKVGSKICRRVFHTPAELIFNPDTGGLESEMGTSDLWWCTRVMKEKFFEKAGWPKYQKMKYPFLVDTNIFVQHIANDGVLYPVVLPRRFQPKKPMKQTIIKKSS